MKMYLTGMVEAAQRDAEAVACELRVAIEQAIYGVPPGAIKYELDQCIEDFKAAIEYLDAAWAEWGTSPEKAEWEKDMTKHLGEPWTAPTRP